MGLKYEWRKYIEEMRKSGYAVVVFSPEELGRLTSAKEAEEWMIECVNECLEIRRQDDGVQD